MGQKEVENENYCGVFEMRDLERIFSEVLTLLLQRINGIVHSQNVRVRSYDPTLTVKKSDSS